MKLRLYIWAIIYGISIICLNLFKAASPAFHKVHTAKNIRNYWIPAFGRNLIRIKVIESVEEMIEEGRMMHHCVGSYHNRENSLILSATIDGRRIETIEVSLKTLEVVQCRGLCNENTEYHDRIVNLVNSNVNLIRQRMEAA